MRGIDISNDNGQVVWSKVKAEGGKAFAICKASQGLDFTDGDYLLNRAGCRAEGILFGAYHFAGDSRTGLLGSPDGEADRFLALADPREGDMPYCLDMESPAPLDPIWALAFLDRCHDQIGGRGLLYSSLSNLDEMRSQAPVAFARILARHGLWVADWGDAAPALKYVLWQYRGDAPAPGGRCPGVSGACDLDELNPAARLAPYLVPPRPIVRYNVTYRTRLGVKREIDLKPGPLGGVGFQFARHHLGREAAHGRIVIDPIRRD